MLVAAYVIVKLAKPLHCKLHFHTSGDHIRDEKKKKLSGTTSQVHFKNGRYSGKASSYLEIDQTWHLIALASFEWSKISMWLVRPATVAHCQVGKLHRCPCQSLPIANTPCLDSAHSLNLTPLIQGFRTYHCGCSDMGKHSYVTPNSWSSVRS